MQFQAMNHAINKFSRFIQYHWRPHPEGSGCPRITPSGHVTSSDKITSNKKIMSSGVKVGYSPSLTEALSNTILLLRSNVYVFKCVKKRDKNRNIQLIYYTKTNVICN